MNFIEETAENNTDPSMVYQLFLKGGIMFLKGGISSERQLLDHHQLAAATLENPWDHESIGVMFIFI